MRATIRQNAWGNWYGYIGRRKARAFFNTATQTQEQQANDWLTEQTLNIAAGSVESKQMQRLRALWSVKPIQL
jgi:hypothetical protein